MHAHLSALSLYLAARPEEDPVEACRLYAARRLVVQSGWMSSNMSDKKQLEGSFKPAA